MSRVVAFFLSATEAFFKDSFGENFPSDAETSAAHNKQELPSFSHTETSAIREILLNSGKVFSSCAKICYEAAPDCVRESGGKLIKRRLEI